MGRLHAPGKGISSSTIPYNRRTPHWLKVKPEDAVEMICDLAKKGIRPSSIAAKLRDTQCIGQVRYLTGNRVLRILRSRNLGPQLPEELYYLIKKAINVRKHLEKNKHDIDSKYRLILMESRIHRLARYYKRRRIIPPNWKYSQSNASALVA